MMKKSPSPFTATSVMSSLSGRSGLTGFVTFALNPYVVTKIAETSITKGATLAELENAYERFCPDILRLVMQEVVRAEKLHGVLPRDTVRAAAIAGEEMGEVFEAALDATRYLSQPYEERLRHLRDEWVQLAAVALRAIEHINKDLTGG